MRSSPDPADVAVEIDVIRSFTELNRARPLADPRELPTALILDEASPAARRLLDALGDIPLLRTDARDPLACAWLPRARLGRALAKVEPLEAIRLAQAPATDGRLWTVVHGGRTCRVAVYGKRGPVARGAEEQILGIVYRGCMDTRCIDDAGHDWEEREIRSSEDGEVIDDTTCTRCGIPSDLHDQWSTLDFEY